MTCLLLQHVGILKRATKQVDKKKLFVLRDRRKCQFTEREGEKGEGEKEKEKKKTNGSQL